MKLPSILIFSAKPFHNAPRILREIEALKNNYTIHCIGQSKPGVTNVYFENIYAQRTLLDRCINYINYMLYVLKIKKNYTPRFSKIIGYVVQHNIKVILIHEPVFLPLALYLKQITSVKIVFNAHEYHPLEFEDVPNWLANTGKNYYTLYKKYLRKVDLLINVCDGISQKCIDEFGVKSIVIPNAAPYNAIPLRNNQTESKIHLIHHGVILPSRKIENMIEVAKLLGNNYTLTIMAVVNKENEAYFEQLKQLSNSVKNVKFIPPVNFNEIVATINQYDIGIFILNPVNFNYKYSLPNKFFEYIQAKLAIAIAPSIEMKAIVEKYNLGVVADDFNAESLAQKIKELSKQDILNYKRNATIAAHIENANKYNEIYLNNVKQLLN